jgi:hypothetical protein
MDAEPVEKKAWQAPGAISLRRAFSACRIGPASPEAERKDWQKLWADAQQLLDRVAATPPATSGKKP